VTPFGLDAGLIVSVAWTVICLVAGMVVPFQYAMAQLNGFGRWVFGKLPGEPVREIEDDRGGGQA
jgi:hypothetical protein